VRGVDELAAAACAGREGEFTLSVYCDTEVQLQALTQSTYVAVL
jgi:hypothetical protein